ncbi:transcription factor, partial [Colletotrichum plurivorum]
MTKRRSESPTPLLNFAAATLEYSSANDVNIARCAAFLPTINADPADIHPAVAAMFSPATHEYVASLENRVARLESFITTLQGSSAAERDAMLRTVTFGDHLGSTSSRDAEVAGKRPSGTGRGSSANLQIDLEGSLIYHGATSIYRANAGGPATLAVFGESSTQLSRGSESESKFEHVAEHFGISLQDELVTDALMQFFKWQYPHFMFIYREAFLRDHFGDRVDCKYWSSALLLSVCALGTLMSPDKRHRESSEQFFSAAESILIVSGIAFRMAQDLGFQRDPKHWTSHDASLVTEEDMEIRRRIFWGCYTSDKLISLVLGRPVYLFYDDAEMKPWLPAGFVDYDKGFGRINPLIPCFQEQIQLSKVIEKMLSTLFSTRSNLDALDRQTCLDNLNFELCRWYEALPEYVKWNKWEPPSRPLIPSVAALHVRIALNFDHATSESISSTAESARENSVSSAQDITHILRKYRSQYGVRHSPLIMIYAVMQSARALTSFGTVGLSSLPAIFAGSAAATGAEL